MKLIASIGVLAAVIGLTAVLTIDVAWQIVFLIAGAETCRGSLVFINSNVRKTNPAEYWVVLCIVIAITVFMQIGINELLDGVSFYAATAANFLIVAMEYSLSSTEVGGEDDLQMLQKQAEYRKRAEEAERLLNAYKGSMALLDELKGKKISINAKAATICKNNHLVVAPTNKHKPDLCPICQEKLIYSN